MCTIFANLYVLLTWGPYMVYKGTPYIFHIYIIRCGWLGPVLYSSAHFSALLKLYTLHSFCVNQPFDILHQLPHATPGA